MVVKYNKIALIPARGGSKRIPKKNIINFNKKPMISHTIISAIKANIFDEVFVSTDNEKIAQVSKKYGAKVILRKQNLSDDNAMVKEVCYDFINSLEKNGIKCQILCTLFATAPLRNSKDIKNVVNLIQSGKCDFSLAVTSYDLPPHQALKLSNNNYARPFWPKLINKKAKTIGELVVDNGSTYAFNINKFKKYKSFFGPKLKIYKMPKERSVDLDTLEDLKLLKFYSKEK